VKFVVALPNAEDLCKANGMVISIFKKAQKGDFL
jgi:hypothetical protein